MRFWIVGAAALLLAAQAQAIRTIPTAVNGIADSLTVARGDNVALSCSYDTTGGVAADSVKVVLGWEVIQWPIGSAGGSVSTSAAERAPGVAIDTTYTETSANGVYRIAPYASFFVDSLGSAGIGVIKLSSPDTLLFTVKDLWSPRHLRYRGAFRVRKGQTEPNPAGMMEKGGRGLTYNPNGNPGADPSQFLPGSLFISGNEGETHDGGYVGEIEIPIPVISETQTITDLPMAEFIQPLTDAIGSLYQSYPRGDGSRRSFGDLLLVPPQPEYPYESLWWTVRQLYNGPNNDIPSMGRIRSTLSTPDSQGRWHLGPTDSGNEEHEFHMSSTTDYMFTAPMDFANEYLGGRFVISGMGDREGGTNGAMQGPGMYAWNPNVPPLPFGAELDVMTIAWYKTKPLPAGSECDSCGQVSVRAIPGYSQEDEWVDGCWMTHDGRQAIAMFGNKCRYCSFYIGDHCSGIWNNGPCNQGSSGWTCGQDPSGLPAKVGQIMFFDPDELARSAVGEIDPWDVHPFATADLTPYVYEPIDCSPGIQGVAYAAELGMVFTVELDKDHDQTQQGDCPIITVYEFTPLPDFLVSLECSAPHYAAAGDSFQVVLDWDMQSTADCTISGDTEVYEVALEVNDGSVDVVTIPGPVAPPQVVTWAAPTAGSFRLRAALKRAGFGCENGTWYSQERGLFVVGAPPP